MVEDKIIRTIYVKKDVWELAKMKISEPLSCYIEKQLEIACNINNDKLEIEKRLYELEQESHALRSKLLQITEEEELIERTGQNMDECIPSINRIHERCGVIGENQICRIANAHGVKCDDLIEYCKVKGYNVVPLFDFVRDTKKHNGGGLR